MVRPKQSSSKKPKNRGSIDFKKIKRKIGRKLPPPKNATNTQVKSKAIVLPEQSVASERVGLAVSRKGLTLKELLQQTSHHNARVRKDALIGVRDLALKYPAELRLHKLAIIEKLRERISDDDKVVRETLYQLLKSVIFPCSKEDIPGPIISLMMAYVFNAMTHIAIDIRLMAFKFFDLIILHYPYSFFLYSGKVLQNYGDILRNSQTYLQDKSKLKIAFVGLVRCLSLLACDKKKVDASDKQVPDVRGTLHAFEPELPQEHIGVSSITEKLEDLLPIIVNCFHEFIPLVRNMPTVESQSFDCMQCILQSINLVVKFFTYATNNLRASFGISIPSLCRGPVMTTWGESSIPVKLKKLFEVFPLYPVHHSAEKSTSDPRSNRVPEKHSVSILPFVPRLVSQAPGHWKYRLVEAFTKAFIGCKPESTLNLACLSAIEEMLLPTQRQHTLLLDASSPDIIGYQVIWIRQLPELLLRLGDRQASASKVVLHLQLRLGQCAPMNSSVAEEYDNMQCLLKEFYSLRLDDGTIHYGPFLKLPKDCQELAICCLYYFSWFDPCLLESLAYCCLCDNLDPYVIFRIIEILDSAYKAGHIQMTEHISFLVTLLARFKVFPDKVCFGRESEEKISNRGTFEAISNAVCSCLSQMGDNALVLKILQKVIVNVLSLKPSLDNMRGILRMIVMLDCRPTKLTEESIRTLSYSLSDYFISAASYITENDDETAESDQKRIFQYYIRPAIFLLCRSKKLLDLVLNLLGSSIMELHSTFPSGQNKQYSFEPSSRVHAVTCILLFMHKDVKIQQCISSCKEAVKRILQNILKLQALNESNMTLRERHKIQLAFDRLRAETDRLHSWDADDLKKVSEVE
ncbi:uncharacterized protein LOC131250885 isoform X2 [Magnolia sinica]|uniref:uncharacterized protein LOC131250885 isoform X2 n=1 Tax=Magnolia sinica TaxID=86752 RepID=UPI00265ADCAB|nr:uncharacterized protein LOC131250885 isoform X2 [Magnolia sinica]